VLSSPSLILIRPCSFPSLPGLTIAGDRDQGGTEIVEAVVHPLRRLDDAPPSMEIRVQLVAWHDLLLAELEGRLGLRPRIPARHPGGAPASPAAALRRCGERGRLFVAAGSEVPRGRATLLAQKRGDRDEGGIQIALGRPRPGERHGQEDLRAVWSSGALSPGAQVGS
jgi:hypothetical protein